MVKVGCAGKVSLLVWISAIDWGSNDKTVRHRKGIIQAGTQPWEVEACGVGGGVTALIDNSGNKGRGRS